MWNVGTDGTEDSMHLLQRWVVAVCASCIERLIIDDVADVWQYHNITNARRCAIMQILRHLAFSPNASMRDVSKGKIDGVGISWIRIDTCRNLSYNVAHPFLLQPVGNRYGMSAVYPSHSMIGEHHEIYFLLEMMAA